MGRRPDGRNEIMSARYGMSDSAYHGCCLRTRASTQARGRTSGKHCKKGTGPGAEPQKSDVPVSSMNRQEAGPASRVPRRCGRRPRMPRSRPGQRRLVEPPRLRCVGTPHVNSESVIRLMACRGWGSWGVEGEKVRHHTQWASWSLVPIVNEVRGRTYGCSSTNFATS